MRVAARCATADEARKCGAATRLSAKALPAGGMAWRGCSGRADNAEAGEQEDSCGPEVGVGEQAEFSVDNQEAYCRAAVV